MTLCNIQLMIQSYIDIAYAELNTIVIINVYIPNISKSSGVGSWYA
jgi:hypothetical protein